jgi:guanosine-3',5'-bis(diphosphate) 3'-pyrophosphohydrolase
MLEHTYDLLHYVYTVEETEEYLREIIKSKYNMSADPIIAALEMAKHAHDGQLRCDGLSYIIHPMRVALMLDIYERNITSKILISALLHDTIEKTCLTSAEIELEFGRYVTKLILSVYQVP